LKKSTLGGVVTIKMPALPVRSPWDNNDNNNHSSNHHNPLHAEEEEETPLLHLDKAKATGEDQYPRQAYITHPTAMPGT
jgi:hypothetical protein